MTSNVGDKLDRIICMENKEDDEKKARLVEAKAVNVDENKKKPPIVEVKDVDVLLGRGRAHCNHLGNKIYDGTILYKVESAEILDLDETHTSMLFIIILCRYN